MFGHLERGQSEPAGLSSEHPRCTECSNLADKQIKGVWYCFNCAPATAPLPFFH